MISAEDIVELEKKWLRYKIKTGFKFYIFFIIFILVITSLIYYMFIKDNDAIKVDNSNESNKTEKMKFLKKLNFQNNSKTKKIKQNAFDVNISKIDSNKTKNDITYDIEQYIMYNNSLKKNKAILKPKQEEPFSFKIEPTPQKAEQFFNSRELILHKPYSNEVSTENKLVLPLKNNQNKIQNKNLVIGTTKINTIEYLKNKFYKTSNISFALRITKEYYYKKEYKKSLKWALIANDLDSSNEDTWYWFAKSKVKLNEKENAIKALKAYLAQKESVKLKALLTKIQHGDSNDL